MTPARVGDALVWARGAVIVHQAEARDRALNALITTPQRVDLAAFLTRFWPALVVGVFFLGALGLVAAGRLSWQDFGIGMVFPLALYVIEALRRRWSADSRAIE